MRVQGELNWERRYRIMRTHTAMHILCGVVWRDYGARSPAATWTPARAAWISSSPRSARDLIAEIEAKCNVEIAAARDTRTQILPREVAFAIPDLIRTKINLLAAMALARCAPWN